MPPTPWIDAPIERPNSEFRLFCFPYAGGGAQVYRSWPKALPEWLEVCPIQMPGRWGRIGEALFQHMDELVQDLSQALLPELSKPFAFFGHSMGALVAFECCRALRSLEAPQPSFFFPSAHRAPQASKIKSRTSYDLPESQLIEELKKLKGTPTEVLEHPEWMKIFLPIIRADLRIVETYPYRGQAPLASPILAFAGGQDHEATPTDMEAWREQTSSDFHLVKVPGDHFFVQSHAPLLWSHLIRSLEPLRGNP